MSRNIPKPEPEHTWNRTLRFRGIKASIDRDALGEFVDLTIPCQSIPLEVVETLKSLGLQESQVIEITDKIQDMTCMNYLMGHRE